MQTGRLAAILAAAVLACTLPGPAGLPGVPGSVPASAQVTSTEGAAADSSVSAEEPAPADSSRGDSDAPKEGSAPGGQQQTREESQGLSVLRAYICKGIEESEPTEAGKSFIPDEGGVWRLCCFSEIGGAARGDTIAHVWYWGDREMATVRLPVGPAARWRTWSTKKILDEWRGEWHVDILGPAGSSLRRLDFSVE